MACPPCSPVVLRVEVELPRGLPVSGCQWSRYKKFTKYPPRMSWRPFSLRHVGRQRVGPLVAEDRVPAVAVADRAEAGVEHRIARVALVADALVVRAGNAEHVEAVVAGLEVGTETSCFCRANPNVMSISNVGVSVQVWPPVAWYTFVKPPSPVGIRIGSEVVGQVVDHRVHVAELAPDLVRGRAVPVELRVVVVAIEGARFLTLIVVRQAAGADARSRSAAGTAVQDLRAIGSIRLAGIWLLANCWRPTPLACRWTGRRSAAAIRSCSRRR